MWIYSFLFCYTLLSHVYVSCIKKIQSWVYPLRRSTEVGDPKGKLSKGLRSIKESRWSSMSRQTTTLRCHVKIFVGGVCTTAYYFLLRDSDVAILSKRHHLLLNEGNQEEDLNSVQELYCISTCALLYILYGAYLYIIFVYIRHTDILWNEFIR